MAESQTAPPEQPSSETRWFEVEADTAAPDAAARATAALDEQMAAAGYTRISGDNYDTPGVVRALGWNDLDGDGEVD